MARMWRRWVGPVVVVSLLMAQGLVFAQPQTQDGFVPMSPEDMLGRETIPAAPLVMTAYAIAWIVLIGYVFVLWRKLGRVERELADVTARVRAGRD